MSHPIVLSDDEQLTPDATQHKKRRAEPPYPNPSTVFIIDDDDPTPRRKPGSTSRSTPLFVPETPMSDLSNSSYCPIIKCTTAVPSNPKFPGDGISRLICLESDNESEIGAEGENRQDKEEEIMDFDSDLANHSEFLDPATSLGNDLQVDWLDNTLDTSMHTVFMEHNIHQAQEHSDEGNFGLEQMDDALKQNSGITVNVEKKRGTDGVVGRKKKTAEEKIQLMEEKKLKKEQEKLRKATLKAEAAEMKKLEKEKQKWEKGKFALKSVVAEIDAKVVELGSIGGHLLSRFSEKGLKFRITSNPIERSIIWTPTVPEQISQLSPKGIGIQYILLVYEAEEFCNLVINETLMDHVSSVQSRYPSYTICYVTNRLMSYIYKREQEQYKNPTSSNGWRHPLVEEALSKLTTHFHQVHSRQCMDEAELAEHVVGLTCSLASCQFRKKLTRLSVNANGSMVPKDSIDRKLIKGNLWLKALVAIPKVQPRFAIAIWKKYPTMKSLLSVYMDPSKSVHEKEFLLKDLMTAGTLGIEDRRLGEICSKRIYRILMAQSGSIKTDDVENGADFFRSQTL